jgi:SET domain-containing protein
MSLYEDENIVVKPSSIEGLGVFAKRSFKKDEVVFRWNPKRLTKQELENLPADQKRYVNTLSDGTSVLMQVPERYVNSSENPNTFMSGETDIALRDIAEGEEITSKYPLED